MLCIEICKKCREYGSALDASSEFSLDEWVGSIDEGWKQLGKVWCPAIYKTTEDDFRAWLPVWKDPPKECPYIFEHGVAAGRS